MPNGIQTNVYVVRASVPTALVMTDLLRLLDYSLEEVLVGEYGIQRRRCSPPLILPSSLSLGARGDVLTRYIASTLQVLGLKN